jgi:hypothetical protein
MTQNERGEDTSAFMNKEYSRGHLSTEEREKGSSLRSLEGRLQSYNFDGTVTVHGSEVAW